MNCFIRRAIALAAAAIACTTGVTNGCSSTSADPKKPPVAKSFTIPQTDGKFSEEIRVRTIGKTNANEITAYGHYAGYYNEHLLQLQRIQDAGVHLAITSKDIYGSIVKDGGADSFGTSAYSQETNSVPCSSLSDGDHIVKAEVVPSIWKGHPNITAARFNDVKTITVRDGICLAIG